MKNKGKVYSINEIYEYVLLSECCNRNHHDGFYKLIIERIKYYIQNNLKIVYLL